MQVHIMLCDATDMISYLVGKQVSKMDQRGFDCKLGQNYPGVVRNRCCASTVCTSVWVRFIQIERVLNMNAILHTH